MLESVSIVSVEEVIVLRLIYLYNISRLGSVDRSIDDENPRRNQRSWRSQMREQQLADNRR